MFNLVMARSRIPCALSIAIGLATGAAAGLHGESPQNGNASVADQRDEILQSPEWQQAMRDWDDWLAVQGLYDSKQVESIRNRLTAEVKRMSARELTAFLHDLQSKLEILKGDEARDFSHWWTVTSAVASDKYAKHLRRSLPDVANISAHELQDALDVFEARRAQTRQTSDAFQRWREQRVAVVQSELHQRHEESQKVLDRAAGNPYTFAETNHFSPSALHNRKSFTDRQPMWFGFGFW